MPRVTPAPGLGATLSALRISNSAGKPVRLGDTWAKQGVVLVHLRHFGCLYCRKQASVMKEAWPDLQARKATVLAVGTGDVAYAAKFSQELALPFPVLSDDDLVSYHAIGARSQSLVTWAKPSNLAKMVSTMKEGYMQGAAGKHQKYLGATHIVTQGGRVDYAWLNDDFSTDAPVTDVLDVLEEL